MEVEKLKQKIEVILCIVGGEIVVNVEYEDMYVVIDLLIDKFDC